jgi:hypothetical protein
MRRFRTVIAVVALALTGAFLPNAPASAATLPDASVAINPQAYEGQRHTIIGSLFARCRSGFEFADLVIDVSQGSMSTTLAGKSLTCDGQWHKQQFSTPEEGWTTGPASVTARLSVTDVTTGDPGKQGVQTRSIYVRPGAKIELPSTATLTSQGIRLVIKARCDKPWVLSEFGVSATQGTFPNQASASFNSDTFPTCDGALHSLTVFLKSSPTAFKKGWVTVDSHIHTLDPEQFDPAPSATATRAVKVS